MICTIDMENKCCLNQNKTYPDLETAWEECGKIAKCKRIMKYGNGFYLRKASDRYYPPTDPKCLECSYVEYHCNGKIFH